MSPVSFRGHATLSSVTLGWVTTCLRLLFSYWSLLGHYGRLSLGLYVRVCESFVSAVTSRRDIIPKRRIRFTRIVMKLHVPQHVMHGREEEM
jgi:hypothetical protein